MSVEAPNIEALGDHDYLVRLALGEDVVTIRMRATPEVVADIAGQGADEPRVIAATVDYLTARQQPDDLPKQLDLYDVVAAYGGYVDDMQRRLAESARDASPTTQARNSAGTEKTPLGRLASEQLIAAHDSGNGRSAHTIYGGRQHSLRQTIIALTAGSALADHDSPGEATLQVLLGHVRLTSVDADCDAVAGDHVVIPHSRHGLEAIEDSVVMLTVAKSAQLQEHTA